MEEKDFVSKSKIALLAKIQLRNLLSVILLIMVVTIDVIQLCTGESIKPFILVLNFVAVAIVFFALGLTFANNVRRTIIISSRYSHITTLWLAVVFKRITFIKHDSVDDADKYYFADKHGNVITCYIEER